jgi:site-specific DNA recombinase
MVDTITADAYLRKSTVDAGKSVARQERDYRNDCVTEGFRPGRVFVDPDLSASRYRRKDRPDYAELVAHVRSGACQMLSLWESSRGSREMAEWVALLDLCRVHGSLIRIYGGDAATYDPRKPRDREALLRDGINAERESETIATRSRAGARDLAFQGKPPGPLLFGYTRTYDERGKLVAQTVEPERSKLLRRFVTDTLDGVSLNSQAQRLNDEGIRSPRGGLWTGQGIARILKNPGYIGKRLHNGEVVADAIWPALISDVEHRKLLRMLAAPGRRPSVDSTLAHMLSGAARCGACSRVLRTQGGTRYQCTWRGCMKVGTFMEPMDRLVAAMVCRRLREPDAVAVFAPPGDNGALEDAQRDLAELRGRLAEFVAQATDPKVKLSAASLAAIEARLTPQIDEAEKRVRVLSTPAVLARYADVDVPGQWDRLPAAVRREFVVALADVVLSPVGSGGRWSPWRLAESRWRVAEQTWGQIWQAAGAVELG